MDNIGGMNIGSFFMSTSERFEPQRTNNFALIIAGFPEDFTLSVVSFPLPTITNEVIEMQRGNTKVKLAGPASYDNKDIVVRDFIGSDIESLVEQWRIQVFNQRTEAIGWMRDYKRNGTMIQFAPDGTFQRTWTVEGMWPSSVTYGDMSNEGGEVKKITMTIAFDRAYADRIGSSEYSTLARMRGDIIIRE